MDPLTPTIRHLREVDIPYLLPLVLSSFAQFPLFSYLHSPLFTNLDFAHDTLWLWQRRLLIGMLDVGTDVVVAEINTQDDMSVREKSGDVKGEEVRTGRKALEWMGRNGYQTSGGVGGKAIIGFAIWEKRFGGNESQNCRFGMKEQTEEEQGRLSKILDEIAARGAVEGRKDQDPTRMEAFRLAERKLHEKFYAPLTHPTLYLDNITVSFLHQRRGVGKALMGYGVELAREKVVDVWTEASPMGVGLYEGLGFVGVGEFVIGFDGGGEEGKVEGKEGVRMPILKLSFEG